MLRTLLFASLAACALPQAVQVKDCSSGTSEFTVRHLSFSPDPAIRGQNGTLESVYEVPVAVEAGTSRYSCTLNSLPVYDETFDLCSQTACPIEPGVHDDFSITEVPDTAGKVSCKIDWRDPAGTQLLCIQMILQLSAEEANATQHLRYRRRIRWTPPSLDFGIVISLPENATCAAVADYDPAEENYGALVPFEEPASTATSSA